MVSGRLTPAAATLTRSSPCFGRGTGRAPILRTSGPPGWVISTTRMVSGIVMSGPERKRDYRISLPIAQGPHRPLQEVSRLILSMISKPRLAKLALDYRQNLTSVLGESIPLRTFFEIVFGSRSPIEVSCPEPH